MSVYWRRGYKDPAGLQLLKVSGYEKTTDDVYNPIREQIEVKKQLGGKE